MADHQGRLFHAEPSYDDSIEDRLRPFFEDFYTVRFNNYRVDDSYLHNHEVVPVHQTPGKPLGKPGNRKKPKSPAS